MNIGIIRLFTGNCGKIGLYNVQEIGLAKALAAKGSNVYVFYLDGTIEKDIIIDEVSEKVKVVYIHSKNISSHGFFKTSLLNEFHLDVLHIAADNQIYSGKVVKWCLKNNVIPLCYFGITTSSEESGAKNALMDMIFKINTKYFNKCINIAKTPTVADELNKKAIGNVKLVPVGLDYSLLNSKPDKNIEKLRREFKLPADKKIILFIGRLTKNKNPMFALKLFNYIAGSDDSSHLLIVGKGEELDDINGYINENDLKNRVTYIKEIKNSEVWKLYTLSDVFINPCSTEIFGMSILESMYYHCPVIAAKAPGPSYIIDDGNSGYIIEDFEFESWVNAINDLSQQKNKIVNNARKKIDDQFNWEAIADKYLELYKEHTAQC